LQVTKRLPCEKKTFEAGFYLCSFICSHFGLFSVAFVLLVSDQFVCFLFLVVLQKGGHMGKQSAMEVCGECGNMNYVPCSLCNGSRKLYDEDDGEVGAAHLAHLPIPVRLSSHPHAVQMMTARFVSLICHPPAYAGQLNSFTHLRALLVLTSDLTIPQVFRCPDCNENGLVRCTLCGEA
jgi:predicted RNA-binding Zn-ribbon protein involved in translation (DUF1610 family)